MILEPLKLWVVVSRIATFRFQCIGSLQTEIAEETPDFLYSRARYQWALRRYQPC